MMFYSTKKLAGAGLFALAAGLPPGKNAMLVKQTCSQCHTPNVVMDHTFDEKTARKIYQKMLGESPDTERGKKIVEYLTTYMGDKSAGDQK
jgi:mono/diheme cytochrome c family protein